jgi:S-ribosylhomocysteine lyase
MDANELGWDIKTAIEVDHRLLKAPHVKLRSITKGPAGDIIYCIDLRVCKPNVEFMSLPELHSLEHFLLEGFRKYLPDNFISVSPMGCQTGFYLVLLNEGRFDRICEVYEYILNDIVKAVDVPYANEQQCGNFRDHSLMLAKVRAWNVLQSKSSWNQVI